MHANVQLFKFIFVGGDRFFPKIKVKNGNDKIDNFKGSEIPEKSKFQKLLYKIFRSH